ncbi:hypothetical protein O3P69_015715 [Scylla paramamosain]|uniref:Uncharacterized protein n=1 Tax=Scylla paramamosain TaxID=85552 RepID=A0AAW0S9P3_SCYPA
MKDAVEEEQEVKDGSSSWREGMGGGDDGNGVWREEGDSDVCLQSVCDPPQAEDNTAGQRAGAAAPSPRKAAPTKVVTGATRQPRGPSGMAPASPFSEDKLPEADRDGMPPVNGRWSPAGRGAAPPLLPVPTASPEPDQGNVMSALQTLMEQMSRLTQDVDDLKTRVQHHHNERHKELGSHPTTNANGVRWKAFLDTTDTVVLCGEHAPTHVQGGRLDYVALINMPTYTAETLLVRSLLSDHFALETTFPVQSALAVPRKRLTVPPSRMAGLVVHVMAWYSAVKGSFADAETDYYTPSRDSSRLQGLWQGATLHAAGLTLPTVFLNCQQTLAAYQRCWQLNPADTESRDAMVTVARHLTDLRQQERKKYWVFFLDRVRRTRSLREVWHYFNSVRGKPRRQAPDGNTRQLPVIFPPSLPLLTGQLTRFVRH